MKSYRSVRSSSRVRGYYGARGACVSGWSAPSAASRPSSARSKSSCGHPCDINSSLAHDHRIMSSSCTPLLRPSRHVDAAAPPDYSPCVACSDVRGRGSPPSQRARDGRVTPPVCISNRVSHPAASVSREAIPPSSTGRRASSLWCGWWLAVRRFARLLSTESVCADLSPRDACEMTTR